MLNGKRYGCVSELIARTTRRPGVAGGAAAAVPRRAAPAGGRPGRAAAGGRGAAAQPLQARVPGPQPHAHSGRVPPRKLVGYHLVERTTYLSLSESREQYVWKSSNHLLSKPVVNCRRLGVKRLALLLVF